MKNNYDSLHSNRKSSTRKHGTYAYSHDSRSRSTRSSSASNRSRQSNYAGKTKTNTYKYKNTSARGNGKHSKGMRSSRRGNGSHRKSEAKKLNYKKIFGLFLIIGLIIYLSTSEIHIPTSFLKPTTQNPTQTSTQTVDLTPSYIEEKPSDISIDIVAIGDIMCHASNFQNAYDAENDTYNFSDVFPDIQTYIQNADIAIGNLETTFAGKDIGYTGYPTFNTPEELAQNIKDLGIDVVSTANNHSLDKRYSGLVSTLDELDKVNLSHTGTYRSVEEQNTILTKNVNGINIAFLSFTYGTNGIPVPQGNEHCINLIDEDLMLDQIAKAKALTPDLICVSMHWGEEYKLQQNATQEKLADFLFKNGVDIIFGSHPHVLEPMEKRTVTLSDGTKKDGFLIYSLGNFMSGQVIEDTRNTIILQLQVTKHTDNTITIDSYDYVPIYMYDKGAGQPNRFKILDINKTISAYEAGNSDISEGLYNTLKSSREKIKGILGK